jgi:hypothetical protein
VAKKDHVLHQHILVGGFNPSEKYCRQFGLLFPTEWKNKTCSKPPTSYACFLVDLNRLVDRVLEGSRHV